MDVLGVDIGGTKVAFRLRRSDGTARDSSFRWPSSSSVADDLKSLSGHARSLPAAGAVGVAMPGTVDSSGRVVSWPNRPHWIGVDFRAVLGELFPGTRPRFGDDGALAAAAEAAELGSAELAYIGVGTGVGGGIVAAGRLFRPSEVGHMIVERHGAECVCGRRGCLQAIASGPATLTRASRRRGHEVSFDDLRTGVRRGLSWAVSAVDDTCTALAVASINLTELVHPDAIVIGGGFAAGIAGFVEQVQRYATELGRTGHPAAPVREAVLGGLASLHGAVLLARDPSLV